MSDAERPADVRLAELLGGLSLACDVVNGFPHGKVVRTALVAAELARAAGESDEVVRDALYVTLLRFLGCTGFAHEEASIYGAGDDLGVRNVMAFVDAADPVRAVAAIGARVARHARVAARARAVGRLLGDGVAAHRHARAQCDTSIALARTLGASERIVAALSFVCERWDGRGEPARAEGEALAISIRIFHVADVAELAHHRLGRDAMASEVKRRAGGHLDPRLAAVLAREHARFAALLEAHDVLARFLAAEPAPHAVANEDTIDDVARALGRFVDLKSVHTLAHSSGVARLAGRAARELGLSDPAARELVRAGHLHDLGRLSVPNRIWDRPGPLDFADLERVRLHGYYTERILARAPGLRTASRIATAAHERLDGSGYHRALDGAGLSREARLLAVCDAAHAMSEARAHRGPRSRDAIARELQLDVRRGALDATAVEATLAALGVEREAPRATPLSERELEVLRLVAVGKTNREIATILGISQKTVQHHVAHAYEKIGVYSRAGAALWVVENGLAVT